MPLKNVWTPTLLGNECSEGELEKFEGKNALFVEKCMEEVCLIKNSKFSDCTFKGVSFNQIEILGSSFEHCHFDCCEFHGMEATYSRFAGCEFETCDLTAGSFDTCDFRHSKFNVVSVECTVFERCKFKHAKFKNTALEPGFFSHCRNLKMPKPEKSYLPTSLLSGNYIALNKRKPRHHKVSMQAVLLCRDPAHFFGGAN